MAKIAESGGVYAGACIFVPQVLILPPHPLDDRQDLPKANEKVVLFHLLLGLEKEALPRHCHRCMYISGGWPTQKPCGPTSLCIQ